MSQHSSRTAFVDQVHRAIFTRYPVTHGACDGGTVGEGCWTAAASLKLGEGVQSAPILQRTLQPGVGQGPKKLDGNCIGHYRAY